VRLPAIFVLCLLSCPPAFARFGISPLDIVVGGSAAIVDATIISARQVDYRYRDHSASCGYVYEARVMQSFKGELRGNFVFASNQPMAPQARHLLFLRSYAGDFPSDQSISLEHPDDPGFDAGVKQARAACVASLPQLKSGYLHAGEFVAGAEPGGQLISVSQWIGLPQDMAAGYGTGPRLVEWRLLRTWLLRHAADVVDTSAPEGGCDDACITLALEETEATMIRHLEAMRRDAAQFPGAAAAIDAAQGAWQDHAAASCESPVPATGSPDRSVRACRLQFTQARARELWLIRNAPASRLGATSGPCSDACVEEHNRDATDAMDIYLSDSRRQFTGNAAVLASINAGQDAWEAYRQANCNAVAPGAGDAGAAGSLAGWCRLRLTEERINELSRLYLSSTEQRD
jgi:uncharacterized protein YecT (DUF1311 family)